jgi:hypothetical protein
LRLRSGGRLRDELERSRVRRTEPRLRLRCGHRLHEPVGEALRSHHRCLRHLLLQHALHQSGPRRLQDDRSHLRPVPRRIRLCEEHAGPALQRIGLPMYGRYRVRCESAWPALRANHATEGVQLSDRGRVRDEPVRASLLDAARLDGAVDLRMHDGSGMRRGKALRSDLGLLRRAVVPAGRAWCLRERAGRCARVPGDEPGGGGQG